MSWLANIGAALLMFVGGVFGFHQLPAQAPNAPAQTQQAQTSGTPSIGNRSTGNAPSGEIVTLMNEIGCSDVGSCISACMKIGMTQACRELQALTASGMQQYTTGSPSGQGMDHTVAFVGNNTDGEYSLRYVTHRAF
jgi:hypothetical protein